MTGSGEELVEVAFVVDEYQGAMIQMLLEGNGIPSLQQRIGIDGAQLGYGVLMGGGSRRVMVHSHRAEEARALLAEARANDEQAAPEPVNARYLEEAQGGHKPWPYRLIGTYALILFLAFVAFAIAFGVFMLLRAI